MGKASRKLKKKQLQEENAGKLAEAREIEDTLSQQIENKAYSEALGTLAKLAEKKAMTPQAMYAGAYAYFMLGDYERAAIWIDNTLQFDPAHVSARILLARLCILQEKVDEGLSIFNLLADKFESAMNEDEQDEIESLAGFYWRNEPNRILEKYPALAKFLQQGEDEPEEAESQTETPETTQNTAAGPVLRLRPQTQAAPAPELREDVASEPKAESPKETAKSALEILRNLKQKIDARAKKDGGDSGMTAAAPAAAAVSPSYAPQAQETTAASAGMTDEARAKLREILDGKRSLVEKVRLLDSFAGGYFAQSDLAAAELFLTEALKLDETDDGLLRNLAVLLAAKGEKQKAFQAAARMQQTDFLLLDAIRKM